MKRFLILLMLGVSCASLAVASRAQPKTLTVLAAISLRDAMTDLAPTFEKANNVKVEFVYGASGQLAAQAKAGSPGDVFISAADKQVDDLIQANVAVPASRTLVAQNTLVLVVPAKAQSTIVRFEDLAQARKIAIGESRSVPAGMYASQVLKHLNLESVTAEKLVYGSNVKQVADYVARGEVDAGLIYATDANVLKEVKVIAVADASWHEPINYPAIVLKGASDTQLAQAFIASLQSESGRAALTRQGFHIPSPSPTTQPAK